MQGPSCWLLHLTFRVNLKCRILVGLTCCLGLGGKPCEMSATIIILHQGENCHQCESLDSSMGSLFLLILAIEAYGE